MLTKHRVKKHSKNIKHKIKILRLHITNRQRILLSFFLQNVKTVPNLDFLQKKYPWFGADVLDVIFFSRRVF